MSYHSTFSSMDSFDFGQLESVASMNPEAVITLLLRVLLLGSLEMSLEMPFVDFVIGYWSEDIRYDSGTDVPIPGLSSGSHKDSFVVS